jgi:death-on-curing protein
MMDGAPWSSLISTNQVIELHARGIAEHSQSQVPNPESAEECVDGRLGNAWTSEVYRPDDAYAVPGLWFAGHLMVYLVRDNCFVDGNKRVGWAASMTVLASLGLTVEASADEAYELVSGILDGRVKSGSEVVQWIAARLKAPTEEDVDLSAELGN